MGTPIVMQRWTRRRGISAGLSMLAGPGLLAACGPLRPGAPEKASTAPVTVSWMTDWAGGARGEATRQSVPAFQAQFPHIKLDQQAVPADTYEALSAHLAAGTLADVVLFSGNFFELWAERNVFMDIGPLLRKHRFDKESVWWEPQYFEHKGKVHGLPYQFTISTWVYNKTWFHRDSVQPPTETWTTNDLLEVGRRLTHAAENRWGIHMQAVPAYAWIWVYASGADLTTSTTPIRTAMDQPPVMEAFQYAIDLIHRHRVAAVLDGKNAVRGLSFANGSLAISVNNSAKALTTSIKDQFEWDVMPTPRWAGTKRRVTNWNHQGHIVTKAAEQRGSSDGAAQFVIWMAGEGGQTIIAKTGGATPVHKKTAFSSVYLDGRPPGLKTQLDMLERKPDQFARGFRIFKQFIPWYQVVLPILEQGFGGEISVREMAIQATQAGNAALDTAR